VNTIGRAEVAENGTSLVGTPPPYSDEELSKQRRRQRPAGTADCSLKIGRAILCKSLQALQHRSDGHEGWPDHEGRGQAKQTIDVITK
jgi:hypothetical protein